MAIKVLKAILFHSLQCLTFNNVLIDMGNEVNCHFCVNSTVEDFQALINIKSMSDNDTRISCWFVSHYC